MASFFGSIRNRLIALVLIVIFPVVFGVLIYALREQRREARLQAQDTALRIARLAAREQERLIAGAHQLLMTLTELPEVRERRSEQCSKLFAGIMKKFPHYTNIAAVTPQGDLFCSGLPYKTSTMNITDRDYFQEALKKRGLGISHIQVGRMSGKPNIVLAYPALDGGGPVQAVVFVGLDLNWLNAIASEAQMPPQSTLLTFDQNGSVFVHCPNSEKWAGKALPPALIKTMIAQKEGTTEMEGSDGVRRLHGFTTLHSSSKSGALFVTVGIPNDVAFAGSMRIFYVSLAATFLAALLAAVGTWIGAHFFIRRRLETVLAAAKALGEVDLIESAKLSRRGFTHSLEQIDEIIEQMRLSLKRVTGRQADFAAMIAHDLRNPLQTIDCAASLLPDYDATDDERRLTGMIRRSCKDLTNLINEFLDFSKFRAGYLELVKEEIDLAEFLRDIHRRHAIRTQQEKILLSLSVESAIGFISADRKKLEQLIENLLSNALKFTPEGGEIELGAQTAMQGTRIWVRDTGTGIKSEEIKTLFSKYRQASNARVSDMQGTGLGLLICKMIAEAHGGRIWVRSQLNRGTTFHVWIPAVVANCRPTGTE
ncbi:MAG TPA: ATP-binding protein [Candidatus Binatia bacterium]|nr:ATP-binding protein [Candidatus Binatia bacterium]